MNRQGFLQTSLVLLRSATYLRFERHFTYVHPRERRTRNLWNVGNNFLPSQTHLTVVILTSGILFEAIVFQLKLLGKGIKIRGSNIIFFPASMKGWAYRRSRRVDLGKTLQFVWNNRFEPVPKAMHSFSFK